MRSWPRDQRPMFYIEVDGEPVVVEDVETWGRWRASADVRVAQDQVGPFWVSTVFLGLDHTILRGPPLIYETMVFGPPEPYTLPEEGPPDEIDAEGLLGACARTYWEMISRWVAEGRTYRPRQDIARYSTRAQALAGHAEMVERWSIAWHELESIEAQPDKEES